MPFRRDRRRGSSRPGGWSFGLHEVAFLARDDLVRNTHLIEQPRGGNPVMRTRPTSSRQSRNDARYAVVTDGMVRSAEQWCDLRRRAHQRQLDPAGGAGSIREAVMERRRGTTSGRRSGRRPAPGVQRRLPPSFELVISTVISLSSFGGPSGSRMDTPALCPNPVMVRSDLPPIRLCCASDKTPLDVHCPTLLATLSVFTRKVVGRPSSPSATAGDRGARRATAIGRPLRCHR